jgi:UDP-glucose:(heptosyl)LPS alpha-1,3-glucosyltransferase
LKLAIVRQRYNPFGGAERFVERALAALVAQGAQITLIARDWEDGADADFEKIICRPPSRGAFSGRTGRDRAFARCVQETIATRDFDLVQSHERIPGCSIFRAGDGVHAAWLERRAPFLTPLARYAQRISPYHRYVLAAERAMFAHPALKAVICNSWMIAAEIEKFFGLDREKLHVIYNGVDTADYHPRLSEVHREETRSRLGIAEDAPLLLYVGSGYERKGVPQLLQAFSSLKRRDAQLVIIGADRKLQATKAAAAGLVWLDARTFSARYGMSGHSMPPPTVSFFQRFTTPARMLRWKRWPAACPWSPAKVAAQKNGLRKAPMAGLLISRKSAHWQRRLRCFAQQPAMALCAPAPALRSNNLTCAA